VETTVETAETPCNGARSLIVPPPQATEGSNGMLSVDEDPAVAEAAERNHEAEIFAGFSLQSNGIRFRAPTRGKTVQGELACVWMQIMCALIKLHVAFS